MCPEVLVISGDFNLHLDDLGDNDTKKFMDLLETFSLSQHVSGPTHLSGHTFDLIITCLSDDVVLASPKGTFPISDHFIIQCISQWLCSRKLENHCCHPSIEKTWT